MSTPITDPCSYVHTEQPSHPSTFAVLIHTVGRFFLSVLKLISYLNSQIVILSLLSPQAHLMDKNYATLFHRLFCKKVTCSDHSCRERTQQSRMDITNHTELY